MRCHLQTSTEIQNDVLSPVSVVLRLMLVGFVLATRKAEQLAVRMLYHTAAAQRCKALSLPDSHIVEIRCCITCVIGVDGLVTSSGDVCCRVSLGATCQS